MFAILLFFFSLSYQTAIFSSMRDSFRNINENLKPFIFEVKNNCEKNFYALKEKYENCRKFMRENLHNLKNFFMQKIKSEEVEESSKMTESERAKAEEAIKRFLDQFLQQQQEDAGNEGESAIQEKDEVPQSLPTEVPADL